MTDSTCSMCGRFPIGICDACRKPVCGFHTGADASIDPSWNGDWRLLLNQKINPRTYPDAVRKPAEEALRRDQRLTHLSCRLESAVALVKTGERYSVPDTADISRRALAAGKPFDCEVWEFAFQTKKLFQAGGYRKVRPLFGVWTLGRGMFLAADGRVYRWTGLGNWTGSRSREISRRDIKGTSGDREDDDLLRAFALTIS